MGVIMALVSFIQSHGNALRAIRCGTAGGGAETGGFCGERPQNGRLSVGTAPKAGGFGVSCPKMGAFLWVLPQNQLASMG